MVFFHRLQHRVRFNPRGQNREGIAEVSAKLLREGRITVSVSPEIEFDENEVPKELTLISYPPTEYADLVISREEVPAVLRLAPRPYVVGIGCRKGMSATCQLLPFRCARQPASPRKRKAITSRPRAYMPSHLT